MDRFVESPVCDQIYKHKVHPTRSRQRVRPPAKSKWK